MLWGFLKINDEVPRIPVHGSRFILLFIALLEHPLFTFLNFLQFMNNAFLACIR